MAKLEKLAAKEERRANTAEIKLEEDTLAFEEFLRENDRSSVDALKMLDIVTISVIVIPIQCSQGHNGVDFQETEFTEWRLQTQPVNIAVIP